MLDSLPSGARLVMDAYYFGYDFWTQLIDGGFTFVVRAGKNIDVLQVLKTTGKVKSRNGLVLYWPQTAIDRDAKPPAPTSMYVADLDRFSTTQGRTWSAFVTVTIRDSSQNPVAGATVIGTWSGGASGGTSLQTDSQGMATFSRSNLARTASAAVFTVTNVTGTLQYSAVMNQDPDNDSDGTTIIINNPFNTASSLSVSEPTIGEASPTKPGSTNIASVVEVSKTRRPLTTEKKADSSDSTTNALSLLVDAALLSLLA